MTITREQFVREWCKDLRSGEYSQCRDKMHGDDGSHCCLGVAEHTAMHLGLDINIPDPEGPRTTTYLPGHWMFLLFSNRDPALTQRPTGEIVSCSCANDDEEWGFAQIADALEAKYLTPATDRIGA